MERNLFWIDVKTIDHVLELDTQGLTDEEIKHPASFADLSAAIADIRVGVTQSYSSK